MQTLVKENYELLNDYYELVEENDIEKVEKRANDLLANAEKIYREQEKLFANSDLFESIAKKEDSLLNEFVNNIETLEIEDESAKKLFINGLENYINDNPGLFDSDAETLYYKLKSGELKISEPYFEKISEYFEDMSFNTYMSSYQFGLNLYRSQAFTEGQLIVKDYPEDALLLNCDNTSMLHMTELLTTTTSQVFEKIHTALKNKIEIEDFKDLILNKSQNLLGMLFNACKMLGQFNYLVKNSVTNGANPEEVYDSSLQLSHAINWMNILVFYLNFAKLKLSANNDGNWYGGEKRRVESREYDFETPKGDKKSIADALTVTNENQLVEIEGVVEEIYIADDQFPPKFSTFVVLKNTKSGDSIKIRAHMHSLINNGVHKGSYCKINGYVKQEDHWLEEGQAGMELDRFSLVELSKESWLADVVYRMKPYHKLYPDEMNMIFTA